MRLVFTGYSGNMSELHEKDKVCLTPESDLWVDVPISVHNKTALTKDINSTVTLCDLLATTYPGALKLHHLASELVRATGHYPLSSIVRSAQDDSEEDSEEEFSLDPPTGGKKTPSKGKAQGNKIIVGKVVKTTHV